MVTQRDRFLDYLKRHPEGADDDQLAAQLSIPQRQTVNRICRELAMGLWRGESLRRRVSSSIVFKYPDRRGRRSRQGQFEP